MKHKHIAYLLTLLLLSFSFFAQAQTDNTPPTITDITRIDSITGMSLPEDTNADTLTWEVVFSEAVDDVGTDDFMLTSVPADPAEALDVNNVTLTVTPVSDANYEVTVSGGGLDEFDGTVSLSIAEGVGGNDITDLADNRLKELMPTDDNESYMVDNTPPELTLVSAGGRRLEEGVDPATLPMPILFRSRNDATYVFKTNEADRITYSGCEASPGLRENVRAGQNIVGFFIFGTFGVFDCSFTVTDDAGNPSTLMVPDFIFDSSAPTVNAGNMQTVLIGSEVTLTATVEDREGARLRYVWSQSGTSVTTLDTGTHTVTLGGADPTDLSTGSVSTTFIAPNTAGDLELTLTVIDDVSNGPTSDSVTISVTDVGIDAGESRTVAGGAPVTLTARSAGLTGPTTTYVWSEVVASGGSPTVTLTPDATMPNRASFTAPTPAPGNDITLEFEVTATSGGTNFMDTVRVTVDATAPTVTIENEPATTRGEFMVDINFNEPVTDFTREDIAVGNGVGGMASSLMGSGSSYTATITPNAVLADGAMITIDIAADVVMDLASNGNEAATRVTVGFIADNTPPVLTEIAAVMPTPTTDTTPEYTFRSSEAGTISYGGACSSETGTATATIGTVSPDVQPTDNTITFGPLADDQYTDCTITVTDAALNESEPLAVSDFTVENIATVSAITTTTVAGSYGIGQMIDIQVEFTEPVEVMNGTPELLLNNGGQAIYSTGSGSSTLTFNYEVSAGQGIDSLDIRDDDALSLVGATINDLSGNPATRSLAGVATDALNNIKISTPSVIRVSGESGNYRAGDEVTIRVQFSEEIMVSPDAGLAPDEAPLQLALETGDVDRMATFSALATTAISNDTLVFTYRVEQGDRSQDLAYTDTGALVAVGDTLVTGAAPGLSDAELRAANLGALLSLPTLDAASSLSGSSDIVIGVLIEEQNTRLNEILLPKIAQAMSAATVDGITRRIESGGGDGTASLSSGLSSGISDILPSGLASLKDLDLSELLSDLSWLKSFAYDFLMDKAEQSARSGSIGLDALGSGFDIKGMLGGFDIKRVLSNSEFVMPLNVSGGDGTGSGATSSMVLWGSGNYSNLSDNDDGLDYDGDIYSINLGIDSQISQETLLGISVNWSNSDFDYRDAITAQSGDYGYRLYGINPYISWSPQGLGGSNLWATVGYGIGEIENQIEGVEKVETDTRQYQFSGGGRYILTSSADSLSQLSIKGDLTLLRVDIEQSAGFVASDIDSQSFRLLLQGSSVFNYADYSFTPSLEGGLRYDLGDGDTGGGIELSPAFTYKSLDDRVLIEGRGRYLIAGQHDQWGLSVLARIDQARHGRGLSFSMHPTWGQSQAQAQQLTAHNGSRFNDYRAAKAEAQMKTELSYGMHVSHILGQTMLLTPYAEFTLGEDARYYQFGQRLSIGELLSLSFKLSHHQRRGYADDNHLGLESTINF